MTPRSLVQSARVDHPTGTAAAVVTVLVWAATAVGVDMPAEVAAALVGIVAAAVSAFTPRFGGSAQVERNDPPAGGTGPDPASDDLLPDDAKAALAQTDRLPPAA